MIPRPLPYLHLVEPHEREIVREPEIEPYRYRGLILIGLCLLCLSLWGWAIWRLW